MAILLLVKHETYATTDLHKENTQDHRDLLLKVTGRPDNITGRCSTAYIYTPFTILPLLISRLRISSE